MVREEGPTEPAKKGEKNRSETRRKYHGIQGMGDFQEGESIELEGPEK